MTRLLDSTPALRALLVVCALAMVAALVWATVGVRELAVERVVVAFVPMALLRMVAYRLHDLQLDRQGELDPFPAGPWWNGSGRLRLRVGVVLGAVAAIGLGVLAGSAPAGSDAGVVWLLVALFGINAVVDALRLWMLARREARFAASLPAD